MAPNPIREKRDLLFVLGQPNPAALTVRVGISGEVQVRASDPSGALPEVVVRLQPPDNFSPTGRKYDLLAYAPVEWWRGSTSLLNAVTNGWLYVDLDPLVDPQTLQTSQPEASLFDLFVARPPNETLGDLLAWNGTTWVRVPDGNAGEVLTSNAPGVPSWQAVSLPPITGRSTMVTQNSTDSSTYEILGGLAFNASDYSDVKFSTLAYVTGGGLTGEIQLYNLTDAVVVTTNTYNGVTSPTELITGSLSLPAGTKVYEVRGRVTGGTPPGDRLVITHAGFKTTTVS